MIRIHMLGRVGNNLFQYATGRSLAEKHGVPLVMDGSWFNRSGWQSVSKIGQLPIQAKLIRDPTPASRLLKKITGKHRWDYLNKPHYREKTEDLSFDPAVIEMPSDCVLFGYFQSPRYFADIETKLRSEIHFHDRQLDSESSRWAKLIQTTESVAIHIRRTDYIGNSNVDICGMEYYERAIKRIQETLDSPEFFVFSDDPEWCQTYFNRPRFFVVSCQSSYKDPMNDLHLMSLARHHIIANSSYSWWAAWIGKKQAQQVLMPSEWFRGINSPIEEKRCEGWETISPSVTSP